MMEQIKQIPSTSNQSSGDEVANSLDDTVRYQELLGNIVERLAPDSKPSCCSTPDTSRKTTPRASFTSSTPTSKTSQKSPHHNAEILNGREPNSQSCGVILQNTNEEVTECINFVCVLVFGLAGFGIFIMFLEFVPNSNLTAALSVVGACMLLVFIFGFMRTLAKSRTPLNRR